jgi:hypothetical protein
VKNFPAVGNGFEPGVQTAFLGLAPPFFFEPRPSILPTQPTIDNQTESASSTRYGPFGLLDHTSQYGLGVLPVYLSAGGSILVSGADETCHH